MKRKLIKMRFDIPCNAPLIRLFGGGEIRIPLEYRYYFNSYDCKITKVNFGGMFRVVSVYDKGVYFKHFNIPFAILLSDII